MRIPLILTALTTLLTTAHAFIDIQYPPRAQDRLTTFEGSVESCGTPDDIFKLEYIRMSPDPPERGKPLTVAVKGKLLEEVKEGAYVDVKVNLGFIKLVDQRFDVCENVKEVGKECPLVPGEEEVTHTVDFPREAPPGRYVVHADLTNYDGKHIACINANFVLKL
ncbi:Phosphatidylglycerol/phosphatidylinositol transfer protein [Rhizophlyctis rosea]|uniref:Phosphatidylglycerol/phosphatidylinositol transfer protein n=1 Tax=Rhizophlyctis rosea TaxID=64517 RepID=A0AAD5WZI4_9FUNG|nr:Phosphatidylglycerol/phosphatidylinositol transfer protein [Rhizophlyctis rosea]